MFSHDGIQLVKWSSQQQVEEIDVLGLDIVLFGKELGQFVVDLSLFGWRSDGTKVDFCEIGCFLNCDELVVFFDCDGTKTSGNDDRWDRPHLQGPGILSRTGIGWWIETGDVSKEGMD